MLAPLIDTTPVCYLGNDNKLVWRPCRVWRTGEHQVLAVVSETTDPTMSIETGAAAIRAFLEWIWQPYELAAIIEHWPQGTGFPQDEHYAEQWVDAGRVRWKHVEAATLRSTLQDFETTKPSGTPLRSTSRQFARARLLP
ncbi:hypothetical protein [Streptomyces sp. NPDC054865]